MLSGSMIHGIAQLHTRALCPPQESAMAAREELQSISLVHGRMLGNKGAEGL